MHTSIHPYLHTHLPDCLPACLPTYIYTHVHACLHSYIHTQTHTDRDLLTRTHAHVGMQMASHVCGLKGTATPKLSFRTSIFRPKQPNPKPHKPGCLDPSQVAGPVGYCGKNLDLGFWLRVPDSCHKEFPQPLTGKTIAAMTFECSSTIIPLQ